MPNSDESINYIQNSNQLNP